MVQCVSVSNVVDGVCKGGGEDVWVSHLAMCNVVWIYVCACNRVSCVYERERDVWGSAICHMSLGRAHPNISGIILIQVFSVGSVRVLVL